MKSWSKPRSRGANHAIQTFSCHSRAPNIQQFVIFFQFAVLLLAVFLFELGAGISGYMHKNEIKSMLQRKFNESMVEYTTKPEIQLSWDTLQSDVRTISFRFRNYFLFMICFFYFFSLNVAEPTIHLIGWPSFIIILYQVLAVQTTSITLHAPTLTLTFKHMVVYRSCKNYQQQTLIKLGLLELESLYHK